MWIMISAAVAGVLTERWRTHSSGWPEIHEDVVFIVQDDAVVALDSGGKPRWTLPPGPGQRWLRVQPGAHGVVVRGVLDADPNRHLNGVADRQTGALYFTESPSIQDGEQALIDMSVEGEGFFRSSQRAARQYFEPTTGQPISPLFSADEIREYGFDGEPHDTRWWPSVEAIGRVGPVTLLMSQDQVTGWTVRGEKVLSYPATAGAHPLTETLYRIDSALVWLDAQTGAVRQTVALRVDDCTAASGGVRVVAAVGVVVPRCGGLDIHDATTGARQRFVPVEGVGVFLGESSLQVMHRGADRVVVQYLDAQLRPARQLLLTAPAEAHVVGDGLLLLRGPSAGFAWLGRDGSTWEKPARYGNVQTVGAVIAWYGEAGLTLLDTDGQTLWQREDAVLIGALSDQTLVVRLGSGEVVGLTR